MSPARAVGRRAATLRRGTAGVTATVVVYGLLLVRTSRRPTSSGPGRVASTAERLHPHVTAVANGTLTHTSSALSWAYSVGPWLLTVATLFRVARRLWAVCACAEWALLPAGAGDWTFCPAVRAWSGSEGTFVRAYVVDPSHRPRGRRTWDAPGTAGPRRAG